MSLLEDQLTLGNTLPKCPGLGTYYQVTDEHGSIVARYVFTSKGWMLEKLNKVQDIHDRIKAKGGSFLANDNIHEFLADGDLERIQAAVESDIESMLTHMVIDVANDHNCKETAKRVAKMFIHEFYRGRYSEQPVVTCFPNVKKLDNLYIVGPVDIKSTCSHHLVPIVGSAWVGIIPGEDLSGLSKFARLAEWVFRRPQIQEEATQQLAQVIEGLGPKSVALIVKAKHMCFSPDTQILTEQGWRRFDKLEKNVRVAQVDYKNGMKMNYAMPQAYIKQRHTGVLAHVKGSKMDILCTPDHEFVYQSEWSFSKGYDNWEKKSLDQISNSSFYLPISVDFIDGIEIEDQVFDNVVLNAKQFCALAGLYLSEGCWRGEGTFIHEAWGKVGIEIVQKSGTKAYHQISKFLYSLGFNVEEYQPGHFFIHSKALADFFIKVGRYCTEMRVPKLIRRATKENIKEFIKWYYLGDGDKWHHKRPDIKNGAHITTSSKRMAKDLQLLYFKLGRLTHVHSYEDKEYQITEQGFQNHKYRIWEQTQNKGGTKLRGVYVNQRNNTTTVPYDDMVYCVQVPTGAIVVKRNGKISIVGNCMSHRGVENPNSEHTTSYMSGSFKTDPALRMEFLTLIGTRS